MPGAAGILEGRTVAVVFSALSVHLALCSLQPCLLLWQEDVLLLFCFPCCCCWQVLVRQAAAVCVSCDPCRPLDGTSPPLTALRLPFNTAVSAVSLPESATPRSCWHLAFPPLSCSTTRPGTTGCCFTATMREQGCLAAHYRAMKLQTCSESTGAQGPYARRTWQAPGS